MAIVIHDLDEPAADTGGRRAQPSTADRLTQLLIDVVSVGAHAMISRMDDAGDDELRDLAAAGAGFSIEACRALGRLAAASERALAGPAAATARTPVIGDLVAHWASVWRATAGSQPSLPDLARRLVDRVLSELDLTELITSHVDLQALAREIDVNALVEDVNVDALTDRIDVAGLVRRVDINELADRIDVDAIASRIDLDELIGRLDLASIASEVIEELDLADLVRNAAAETTSEGVRTVRLRGVDADRAVRRAVDRVLSRRSAP